MTTSPRRRHFHRLLAPVLTGAVLLTVTSCGSDDDSTAESDTADASSSSAPQADDTEDIEVSYDIPERWNKESVSQVLESTMIGGGIDGWGGEVADGALFVGKELNQVQRSTPDGNEFLDVTPLKDETVAQDDYLLESFSREGEDYVALWRQGVPASNDDRRLGDESSSDSQVYLAVWDGSGEPVFDDSLPEVGSIGSVRSGLIEDGGDLIDPLSGDTVYTDGNTLGGSDDDDESIVGYGANASEPLVKTKISGSNDDNFASLAFPEYEYGTDAWSSSEVIETGDRQRADFETIMGDYAVFSVVTDGYDFDEMVAIDIESGDVAARGGDSCSSGTYFDDDSRLLVSPNGKNTVYGEYMIDGSEGTFTCDKDRRGGFEPRLVLDDGTVYGYGSRGSGDNEEQVAASMKIGDDEALMEDGSLPFHVDGDGRGWFSTSVDHNEGTDTYVAVVDPTDGE